MKTQEKALMELTQAISSNFGQVVNVQVVRGAIESFGIREVDVYQDFGFRTIQELAKHIYLALNDPNHPFYSSQHEGNKNENKPLKRRSSKYRLQQESKESIKDFTLGLIHLIPIFLQIIAIVFFGVSLWGYLHFDDLQATAVVLGVILGLIGSGGFIQLLGRQLSFYRYQKDWKMMRNILIKILKANFKVMSAFLFIIIILNFIIGLYPFEFMVIMSAYAFSINLLLLVLAPFYTIRKRWSISLIVGIGTVLSIVWFKYAQVSIFVVHWVTIVLCVLIALAHLELIYRKRTRKEKSPSYKKPKSILAIYSNVRYFFYGTLIFAFIFIDRILAWSSEQNRDFPYIIYYQKDYEIGMDIAILIFFLLTGVLEYSITSFSRFMEYQQRQITLNRHGDFRQKALEMYRRHIKLFIINGLVIALFIYLLISQPWGYQWAFGEPLSQISLIVCVIGGLGYFLMTIGMLNVLYLFTLNQQKTSLSNISLAFFTNLFIGLLASRMISFEYSVVGMLIGSLVFVVLTTRCTLRYFKKIDFYYYAVN